MPLVPVIVIEFDDNSPPESPGFTSEASAWNLDNDWNLQAHTAPEVFLAIHQAVDGSIFRGYPRQVAQSTFRFFDDRFGSDEVTWVSGGELLSCTNLLPSGETPVEKSIKLLFEVVAVFVRYYGEDRVRLIFAFGYSPTVFIPE